MKIQGEQLPPCPFYGKTLAASVENGAVIHEVPTCATFVAAARREYEWQERN